MGQGPQLSDPSRGRFITFEGPEGAGKSTQVREAVNALKAAGIDVVPTREPGGSPGGEAIRALLLEGAADRWDAVTEALMMVAARRDHVRVVIEPALAAGRWVVCDRFADSTMAYQGYGSGLGREAVESLHRLALGALLPDLTLIIDVPVSIGLARARSRPGAEDRFERRGLAFHERLRHGFHEIAMTEPGRCRLIDGDRGPAEVATAVLTAMQPLLADYRAQQTEHGSGVGG